MKGELSHGLPSLVTAGNRILRSDTLNPVLLRGINRSGLEYSEPTPGGFLEAAGISRDEICTIIDDWHANVLRIPLNQEWCLKGLGYHSAETYLASLDQVVAWAAEAGAYTILDLHWLDVEAVYGTTDNPIQGRTANHVPPTPNEQTVELWQTLAKRYQDEPAVIFDLLNEPHDALHDDPHPLRLIDSDGQVLCSTHKSLSARDWARWASLLTSEIRKIRSDGIVLVSGTNWAFDLSGVWIDAPNVVYSTHIYSNRHWIFWSKGLGKHAKVPIFVGEWGGTERDLGFGRRLAGRLRRLGVGWAAWSWSDFPRLVRSAQAQDYEPTPFGSLVRDELKR